MAMATQFVSYRKSSLPDKKSTFYLMIENFVELLQREVEFKSKKIEFLDGGAEWWISIQRAQLTNYLKLNVHIVTKENVPNAKDWSFIFSVFANEIKIESQRIYPGKSGQTINLYYNDNKSFFELKMEMNMSLSPEARLDKILIHKFTDMAVHYKDILSNNELILNQSKYSDFTFVVSGKRFKVHKCILAAASPVFDKIFSSKMKETHTNECYVVDIDPDIFSHLLRFIYFGELSENIEDDNKLLKLYAAAHYYQIGKLVEICKQIKHFNLSEENAAETYLWAITYDLKDVMIDAWKIIKFNILGIFTEMEPPPSADIPKLIAKKRDTDMHLKKYRVGISELKK